MRKLHDIDLQPGGLARYDEVAYWGCSSNYSEACLVRAAPQQFAIRNKVPLKRRDIHLSLGMTGWETSWKDVESCMEIPFNCHAASV